MLPGHKHFSTAKLSQVSSGL